MVLFGRILLIILIIVQILWLIYIKQIISMFKEGLEDVDMDDPKDFFHVLYCRIAGICLLIYFVILFADTFKK